MGPSPGALTTNQPHQAPQCNGQRSSSMGAQDPAKATPPLDYQKPRTEPDTTTDAKPAGAAPAAQPPAPAPAPAGQDMSKNPAPSPFGYTYNAPASNWNPWYLY